MSFIGDEGSLGYDCELWHDLITNVKGWMETLLTLGSILRGLNRKDDLGNVRKLRQVSIKSS